MPLPKLAFLDMDGVIADFVGGVVNAHQRPSPYLDSKSFGVFDMELLWGISPSEFWKPTDNSKFWDTLEKTPEADQIVEMVIDVFGTDNVAILTAPAFNPYCIPGKRSWLRRHYPNLVGNLIFSSAKKFLAGPNRFLIDDRDKNIEAFNLYGGKGITLPRLWNRLHHLDTLKTLEESLKEL